jgi:SAM-dependent methyltransferase
VKALDRYLQNRRIAMAEPWIPRLGRVLDVGGDDGALFRWLGGRFGGEGISLDPNAPDGAIVGRAQLVRGVFPGTMVGSGPFDAIVMLAVLEHVPEDALRDWVDAVDTLLAPGGRVVITVPSARVDPIIDVLRRLRILDGMESEEHHGFDHKRTPTIFEHTKASLLSSRSFQFGLNHLYVFQRARPLSSAVGFVR